MRGRYGTEFTQKIDISGVKEKFISYVRAKTIGFTDEDAKTIPRKPTDAGAKTADNTDCL